MADCFISYSTQDAQFAEYLHRELKSHGVTVFMAGASLLPGQDWSQRVWTELKSATWVVFLASRAACSSAYVQQELGGAIGGAKQLIPIVWDMAPNELPGWVNRTQALDLRGATIDALRKRIAEIAARVKADKQIGHILLAALVATVLLLSVE